MNRFIHLGAAILCSVAPAFAFAGEVLLTLTVDGEARDYDMAALEALGETEFTTTTIWTEGAQTFAGVPLNVFLADAGVESGTLTAKAINDYAVEMPVSAALEDGPIIAYSLNGAPMSVREKGPLWIVYPYDSDEAFRTEVVYSRSIWQLDRLDVAD